jgi:hypothetical protein
MRPIVVVEKREGWGVSGISMVELLAMAELAIISII